MKHSLTFLPHNLVTHARDRTTVFNAANWAGLPIDSTCGGRGICGKCKVRLLSGNTGTSNADRRFLSAEQLAEGWRLSCRALIQGACAADPARRMASPKACLSTLPHLGA